MQAVQEHFMRRATRRRYPPAVIPSGANHFAGEWLAQSRDLLSAGAESDAAGSSLAVIAAANTSRSFDCGKRLARESLPFAQDNNPEKRSQLAIPIASETVFHSETN